MKLRSLKNWINVNECKSLIYFAQLMDEMLFDFSLDTYKPSVMHSGLLCVEAKETFIDVDNEIIAEPNIHHVIDELCINLEKDAVAQSLINLPISCYLSKLKNKKNTLKEMKSVIDLLSFSLNSKAYLNKNKELLSNAIKSDKDFSEIRRLARTYLTSLIHCGYSNKFIRKKLHDYFFYKERNINSKDDIDGFLNIFKSVQIKYSAIFKVDKVFEFTKDALSHLDIELSSSPPDFIDLEKHSRFTKGNESYLYAHLKEINAMDIYSAKAFAEERLKGFSSLLNLFHHKSTPTWQAESLIFEENAQVGDVVRSNVNPMHKCSDHVEDAASRKLNLLINEFSLEKGSFLKFVRSTQLHAMALASSSRENQILNIWISLESLIPSETKQKDISSIEHICNSVIPFLNEQYISKLLNNLFKDLLNWNRALTRSILKDISGKKYVDKLAKLLALDEYAEKREQFISKFNNFHLLNDRFLFFSEIFKSPEKIVNSLEAHKKRLEWQIRRIYRARNIIVHSGKIPKYTNQLIEHSHEYLDIILYRLVELASNPKSINSVAQGFNFVGLRYKNYIDNLNENKLKFQEENIHGLLFYH